MALSADRQKLLDPVLEGLRQISGVTEVQQDDFNSTSINVFVTLTVESRACMTSRTRPYRFYVGIRKIKAAITQACNKAVPSWDSLLSAKGWEFLDWPSKKYIADGSGGRLDDGYTHENIKIEVFI